MSTTNYPVIIDAKTPDHGLALGLEYLRLNGIESPSRNGPVLRMPGPVLTAYPFPDQRVSFSPLRDANPFFHLYEALWMLAGRNDADSVARYAKNMAQFANEKGHLWGAYGYRWRTHFGYDQLLEVVEILRRDTTTRRCVLTMWDPDGDLRPRDGLEGVFASKDVPCNTQCYFSVKNGKLDMTVVNRSNDIVWGCYGANVVHMSLLHEWVAGQTCLPLGTYYQFSNDFHVYSEREDVKKLLKEFPPYPITSDVYPDGVTTSVPIAYTEELVNTSSLDWLKRAEDFVVNPTDHHEAAPRFIRSVAAPLMRVHAAYKAGESFEEIQKEVAHIRGTDWAEAALAWVYRRLYEAKKAV